MKKILIIEVILIALLGRETPTLNYHKVLSKKFKNILKF